MSTIRFHATLTAIGSQTILRLPEAVNACGGALGSVQHPPHPGEMLLEEFLKPLGLSQAEAAARMKITTNRLNEIVRQKPGVTADTAWRLSDLLGTSPEAG